MTFNHYIIIFLLIVIILQIGLLFNFMDREIILQDKIWKLENYRYKSEKYMSPLPGISEKDWGRLFSIPL